MNPEQFAAWPNRATTASRSSARCSPTSIPAQHLLKLAAGPYSYLLESVEGGEKWGRYSIIGLPCRTVLRAMGHRVTVEVDGRVVEEHESADPLAFVDEFRARYRVADVEGMPRFSGAWWATSATTPSATSSPSSRTARAPTAGTPDILLMVSDEVIVFDNLRGRMYVIVHVDPTRAAPSRRPRRASPTASGRCSAAPARRLRHAAPRGRGRLRLRLHRGRVQAGRRAHQAVHPGRRLHAGRAVAAPVDPLPGAAARPLPRPARLNPSPICTSSTSAPSNRRLVARDPHAARGRRRHGPAHRRTRRRARRTPRTRPRGRAARRPEGARRAPDADRPRPQRRRARGAQSAACGSPTG